MVETASSQSSLEIAVTRTAQMEEKRATIVAAAEERKELGERIFEVASRFAQLDTANSRCVERAFPCTLVFLFSSGVVCNFFHALDM